MTSEKLSKLSIEEMVKAILAKSGIVSFTRVIRIIRDALIMSGKLYLLQKEAVLGHLMESSASVLADSQSFVAVSSLIYPDNKRKSAIRDAILARLLKTGSLDATQLMADAKCDFKFLGPIIETIATIDKRTREFHLKTFQGDLDPEICGFLAEARGQEA